MSDVFSRNLCSCGYWTFEQGAATHDEPRKYGTVTHRRTPLPCFATYENGEDVMVEQTWRERALAAEAQVQRVRELLAHPRDYRGNGSEWNECRDAVLRALDGGV